ncbi:MAG: YqgE/AlgH family protein [Gammaproteobacteria bacterium]
MRYLTALILLPLVFFHAASGAAPPALNIERGALLVANEALGDPNFDSSVVLLIGHGSLGSLGLIINRPYPDQRTIEIPDTYQPLFANVPQHFGGPVPAHGLHALIVSEYTIPNAIHIKDELYFVDNPQAFDYLLEEQQSVKLARLYRGIASWIPGQLAAEIDAGAWYLMESKQGFVFSDNENLWEELLERIHGKWARRQNSARKTARAEFLLMLEQRRSIMREIQMTSSVSSQVLPLLKTP